MPSTSAVPHQPRARTSSSRTMVGYRALRRLRVRRSDPLARARVLSPGPGRCEGSGRRWGEDANVGGRAVLRLLLPYPGVGHVPDAVPLA